MSCARRNPKSHQDLIRLLERSPDVFRGKVATYDIGVSGGRISVCNNRIDAFREFLAPRHALGTVKAQLFCCTEDMIASLVRGDAFIALICARILCPSAHWCNPTSRLFCGRLRGGGGTDHRNPRRAAHPMLARTLSTTFFSESGQPSWRKHSELSVTDWGPIVNR